MVSVIIESLQNIVFTLAVRGVPTNAASPTNWVRQKRVGSTKLAVVLRMYLLAAFCNVQPEETYAR